MVEKSRLDSSNKSARFRKFSVTSSISYLGLTRDDQQIIEACLLRFYLVLLPAGISDCRPATLRETKVRQYFVKPQPGLVIQLATD